jgi:hypothetical protein
MGLDQFRTRAVFKVRSLRGTAFETPLLEDAAARPATIGRSDPFTVGQHTNGSKTIALGAFVSGPSGACDAPCAIPDSYPLETGTRAKVRTQILQLELVPALGSAFRVRAGQSYFNSPGLSPAARNYFFQPSCGEVASLWDPRADRQVEDPLNLDIDDFPAEGVFNVFAEVTVLGGLLRLYNLTPIVVYSQCVPKFPPDVLGLPEGTYVHDPSFPAVPLYLPTGAQWGYLQSAGHGVSPPAFPLPAAPVLIDSHSPVSFSVDRFSTGLPALVSAVNAVRGNSSSPGSPLSVYRSSGTGPGGPDTSNARSLQGVVGGPLLPAFTIGDEIASFSFGRDGTLLEGLGPTDGNVFFSIDRSSRGPDCSDIRFLASRSPPRQATAIFVAPATASFGRYVDCPTAVVPPASTGTRHFMVTDGTALGLRPMITDMDQDDVTGIELSTFAGGDPVYATFRGPSFTGPGVNQGATIFVLPPQRDEEFDRATLQVFSLAAGLGLDPADRIDALALSDVTPRPGGGQPLAQRNQVMDAGLDEALFSLANSSPSLAARGFAPGDVLYSTFDGNPPTVFLSATALGLAPSDELDALDIMPSAAWIPEEEVLAVSFTRFIRGDANVDGRKDVSDAVFTLNVIFRGLGTFRCQDAAEFNDDGQLDVSDAIGCLSFLFLQGRAPSSPFPGCGCDPTADALLFCSAYPMCN